ncbi:hypothetical protein AURDEDRAFT_186252 [Auricularia subglabra TFB-10046 SS5]|nr:hypothetical protein AURDEDRAFT_186252 [Auricularia subglabra TFB-10046 SS5]
MSAVRSEHAARLRAETDALDQLDIRICALRRQRADADEALRQAQRCADALAIWHIDLEERRRTTSRAVQTARAAYVRDLLESYPEDVLGLIFEACADLPDEMWQDFGYGVYNHQRAVMPFYLASVCSLWRRVALSLPRLWTYIGVPSPPIINLDEHLRRINLLLSRSAACPFQIQIQEEWVDRVASDDKDPLWDCFSLLAQHADRWAKVELWAPREIDAGFFDVFRCPLPLLTELSLNLQLSDDPAPEYQSRGGYLAFAPRLRKLDIAFGGIKIFPSNGPAFPELSYLRYWENCPADVLAWLVSQSQATLEYLSVNETDSNNTTISAAPLVLSHLHTLSLAKCPFFASWTQPGMLSFPALSTLLLSSDAMSLGLLPLLTTALSKVTRLELFGEIKASGLDLLMHLSHITHLAFVRPWPDQSAKSSVADAFFIRLADAAPRIWPKLRSLRLSADSAVSHGRGGGILHLVITRSVKHTEGESPCSRIDEVILDHRDAPPWLLTQVAQVLQASGS